MLIQLLPRFRSRIRFGLFLYVFQKIENKEQVVEIASWIEKGEFDRVYLSQQTQKSYTDYELLNDSKAKQQFNLSDREKEILRLILEECTTKMIAEKLFLSEKTIENYRSSLLLKLEVSNIAGLVKKTILLGLLND